MDFQTVEKPAFSIAGRAARVSMKNGENMREIPEFWRRSAEDGTLGQLAALSQSGSLFQDHILGVCADFSDDMGEFTYLIAAESAGQAVPPGMVERAVPAATWAVFEAAGALPDSIQTLWGRIMSEFFATSGYEHGDAPDLEVYPPGDPMRPDYRCGVWVPIVRK